MKLALTIIPIIALSVLKHGGNMEPLQQLTFVLILALQKLSPALDGVMNFFTFLGRIEFYLLIIPVIYWVVDKRLGFRLLLILVTTDIFSSTLKLLFHQPRPYWMGKVLGSGSGDFVWYPVQPCRDSLAVWGYLAYRLNRKWLWILIGVFVLFIGLSRLYLGVHFLHDVLFGWLLGLVVIWVFIKTEDRVAAWANGQSIPSPDRRGLYGLAACDPGRPAGPDLPLRNFRSARMEFLRHPGPYASLCVYTGRLTVWSHRRICPDEELCAHSRTTAVGCSSWGRYVLGIVLLLVIYTGWTFYSA